MNTLRRYSRRFSHAGWLALSILSVLVVTAAPVVAECVTHHSETFNVCGNFNACVVDQTWREDANGCLKHFLRFENLPPYGDHYLLMAISVQDLNLGAGTPETMDFLATQLSGCDGFGAYSTLVTCGEDNCSLLTNYDLGMSGTTDICIGIESNNMNPIQGPPPPDGWGRDEVLADHGELESCHDHPVIVTTDPETLAVADVLTNPGVKLFGTDYFDTQTSNDEWEILQEGPPSGGKTKLKHVWRFDNVPPGLSHQLLIEGYRLDNPDGDNFQFGFNTSCCTLFQTIPGAVINSDMEISANYAFGSGALSGTIYIAVWDTVAAGTHRATVNIDKLAIRTIIGCP